jgi:hypothetical protein
MRLITGCSLVLATALLAVAHPRVSEATSLNIDFGTTLGTPANTYGAAAGQVGYWNGISSTGTINLRGLDGSLLPGVDLTLNSVSLASNVGGPQYTYTGGDKQLIQDSFYVINGSWSLGLSGLDNGAYDLYVYGPRNELVSTSSFSVNGVQQSNLVTPIGGNPPLQEGVDYEIVKLLVSDHNISIASGPDAGEFSGLAGLQLVQVAATPIPGTLLLFGSGLGLLGFVGWRKKNGGALIVG